MGILIYFTARAKVADAESIFHFLDVVAVASVICQADMAGTGGISSRARLTLMLI